MRHLPPGRRMSVVRVTRLLLGSIAACAAAATAATPSIAAGNRTHMRKHLTKTLSEKVKIAKAIETS